MRPTAFAPLLLVAFLVSVTGAAAEGDAPSPAAIAAADEAFREAKRLSSEGKHHEACAKYEDSQRLAPGSGTLLNLGDCYEKIGRTASAWVTFGKAAFAAADKGNKVREREALGRAGALEPKLSRLRIVVPPAARIDGFEIHRGEQLLEQGLWDEPVPVDPGAYTVTASAPRHERWSTEVRAEPGTIVVTVPQLAAARVASAAPKPPTGQRAHSHMHPPAPPGPQPLRDAAEPAHPGRPQRIIGWVMAGLGTAALITSVVFGVIAIRRRDKSDEGGECNEDNLCTPDGLEERRSALDTAHVSTGNFVGGTVLFTVGLTLVFTVPGSRGTPAPGSRGTPAPGQADRAALAGLVVSW